jgi:hypothetical protein
MSKSEEEEPVDPPILADAADVPAEEPVDRVGKLATILRHLNLSQETVIGIFGKENDLGALLRTPTGDIVRVKVGDAALGGVVKAIGQRSVIILAKGRTKHLRIAKW